jgi:hypothetical protein
VVRTGLTQQPPDDLLDLDPRLYALVDIEEVAERVVPSLLERQVEDDMAERSSREVLVVGVAPLEEMEPVGCRIVLVHLQRAVDSDVIGIDTMHFDEMPPDEDGWSLSGVERPLRVISFARIPSHDVRITDVDRIRLAIQTVGDCVRLGLLAVR